jgi:Uma2 family endonuclease
MHRTRAKKAMSWTVDDLLDLEIPEHLRAYELVDGALVEMSHPNLPHGRIIAEVAYQLRSHLERTGTGGTVYAGSGFVLELAADPERLRVPDVCWLSGERLREAGGEPPRGWLRLAPDLVVEVDSPNRRPAVEQRRIQDYLDAGVRLLWVIHGDAASATSYHADGSARLLRVGEALDGSPVLPGFQLPLARLFPDERTAG